MTLGCVLVLLLVSASVQGRIDAEDAPLAAATLLPPLAGRGVTAKQARGVGAGLRTVFEAQDAFKPLPVTRQDDDAQKRCVLGEDVDAACLSALAEERGASRIAVPLVTVAPEGGILVTLVVVAAGAQTATAKPTALFRGKDDTLALEQVLLEAFAPHALRGTLLVEGEPGDAVWVDGRYRGHIPLTLENLRARDHVLRVVRAGFDDFSRTVQIKHRQTTTVKALLLPTGGTAALGQSAPSVNAAGPDLPMVPLVLLAGGGLIVVGGAVAGTFSLLDSLEVEKRANAHQLVFPRDAALMQRGAALAVVADVLYAMGTASLVGGAVVWALAGVQDDGPDVGRDGGRDGGRDDVGSGR